jgi:hypothetical protein
MTLRAEFSLGHSEFNEFLFATVGEENNGTQLTVLSALTRLGFDPWGEAARLSDLPRETATRALALIIALLPEGDWKASDAWTIAARLVKCLPGRSAPVDRSPQAEHTRRWNKESRAWLWLAGVALVATVLFAVSYPEADHAPGPAPNAVSAPQR